MNRFERTPAAVAVALALAALQAQAQDSPPPPNEPVQKVVITGSNIKRIDVETATPVQVMRREEIARLGVNSVKEALDTLTSASSTLSDIGGSNSFAGGASAANLRNLGKMSTLILLNSRRVAPYALADYNEVFTNLDALPLDAVDRIEVLRNGGSSIYGSDAVAGVINIITRSDYHGLQARASYDRSLKNSEFREHTASLTGGFGDLDADKYNILANVEVFGRHAANWREVINDLNPSYGDWFPTVAPGSGLMFGDRGTPSTFSFPGNLIGQGALPGCATRNASGLCVYDRFAHFEAQPEADRANMLVSGRFNLGDNLEAFAELLYSHTRTLYHGAQATYGSTNPPAVWGDPATDQQRIFNYRGLPATHPLNTSGEELELRYRFADDPAFRKSTSDQYRALAGLKGTWRSWDWESALGIMGSKTDDVSRGGFFSASGFQQVIGSYADPFDPADPGDPLLFQRGYQLGQMNTPEVLNLLFPENGYEGKITQQFWDAKMSGPIAQIGGRDVSLAVGADVRHEKFEINPSANLAAGDIVSNGVVSANASRTNYAAFAEASIPLAKTFELQAAARYDKFPGFEGHFSPKLAFRWEALPTLMLRGTLEHGFRAPNLTESAQSTKFAFDNGIVDPRRCPQAQALANDLRAQSDALPADDPNAALLAARADIVEGNECAAGVASIVRNNPNLKPETSRSGTVGFVLEPLLKGYNLSLDWWTIERKNEIGLKSTNDLLAAESDQAPGVINRLALTQDKTFSAAEQAQYGVTAGPLASTAGMFENVSKTKTTGFDLGAAARVPTRFGRVDVTGNATFLRELKNFSSTLNNYGDNLAGRYGSPKTVANLDATLTSGAWTNGLRLTYNSPTALQTDFFDETYNPQGCADQGYGPAECRVASYVRWDYHMSYTGIRNVTISAFVRNLFDHRPPLDLRAFGNLGGGVVPQNIEDVQGRSLRVTLEYKFR